MANLNSAIVGNIDLCWPQEPALAVELIAEADDLIRRLEDYETATRQMFARVINQLL